MTAATDTLRSTSLRAARTEAVVTWAYAGGFGIPAIPVGVYLLRRGSLPSFLGLFDMYGGPWANRLDDGHFVVALVGFAGVTAASAWAAWRVWRGSRRGALAGVALLPVEAVFWIGFALPIPCLVAAVRVALLAAAWRRLR